MLGFLLAYKNEVEVFDIFSYITSFDVCVHKPGFLKFEQKYIPSQ